MVKTQTKIFIFPLNSIYVHHSALLKALRVFQFIAKPQITLRLISSFSSALIILPYVLWVRSFFYQLVVRRTTKTQILNFLYTHSTHNPNAKRAPARPPALSFSIDSGAMRHWWLEHVTCYQRLIINVCGSRVARPHVERARSGERLERIYGAGRTFRLTKFIDW